MEVDVHSLVISQFENTWKDYYAWEPSYCADKLSSLRAQENASPRYKTTSLEDMIDIDTDAIADIDDTGSSTFTRFTMNAVEMSGVKILHSEAPTTIVLPDSYPPYQFCTPVSRNILHGDDPEYLPFLPFSDDISFDPSDYVSEHEHFAWQENYHGSDILEIVLETARRLHYKHGLSIQQIDQTEILPRALQTNSVWGAIWTGKMTDPIPWTASSQSLFPPLPDLPTPQPRTLQTRLEDYLALCCPYKDCAQANCSSHATEQYHLDLDNASDRDEPLFRRLSVDKPCGINCVATRGIISEVALQWSEQEIHELQVICSIATPMTPCDLACLCRKPCFEVAMLCQKFGAGQRREHPMHEMVEPIFGNELRPNFVPNKPCSHTGPCRDCVCVQNQAHCSSQCRCVKQCERRWKGCQCSRSSTSKNSGRGKRFCATDKCPCRSAMRECDPEVCIPCQPACRNQQIQSALHKRVEVKPSKHGLGLFLASAADKGDLILEYVGELIYEPTFVTRCILAAHVNRYYTFALNSEMSIDATNAGNLVRYINHAPYRSANTEVFMLLVNGEQRIGVYAKKKLSRGSELFLDYGPQFPMNKQ